jgi:hypothetical protein
MKTSYTCNTLCLRVRGHTLVAIHPHLFQKRKPAWKPAFTRWFFTTENGVAFRRGCAWWIAADSRECGCDMSSMGSGCYCTDNINVFTVCAVIGSHVRGCWQPRSPDLAPLLTSQGGGATASDGCINDGNGGGSGCLGQLTSGIACNAKPRLKHEY